MKTNSPFFARIRADVLAITRAVPRGELVSFVDVGHHLDVVPRHVAYILANLGSADEAAVPWHRAVPADGWLKTPKADHAGRTQAALLEAEGVILDHDRRIVNLAARLRPVRDLPHGVPQQQRPVDAPRSAAG
jgi:methylated-DNA-protein-cysteine methyltransferase-like protein